MWAHLVGRVDVGAALHQLLQHAHALTPHRLVQRRVAILRQAHVRTPHNAAPHRAAHIATLVATPRERRTLASAVAGFPSLPAAHVLQRRTTSVACRLAPLSTSMLMTCTESSALMGLSTARCSGVMS